MKRTKIMTIRLKESEMQAIEELAAAADKSKSDIGRIAINRLLGELK